MEKLTNIDEAIQENAENEETGVKKVLDLFKLTDETQQYLIAHNKQYSEIAMYITDKLYKILFERHFNIIGINHRVKSPESLKEKIVRKKLYKNSSTITDVLTKMPDIIGIMIECEFIDDEQKIFAAIKEYFSSVDDNGFYYNADTPNIFVNLNMTQPVRQKNGNELYKLDCYYKHRTKRINFEIQIKSLVNSFWCEVEHNIVYKNNSYIPSDDYVKEMLSAVRINLAGLDKILQLVNDRINALTEYNIVKDVEFNSHVAKQLISDLFNAKMIESIGFTVEFKKIRDLLAWYIMHKAKGLPDDEKPIAFYKFSYYFKELHNLDFSFDEPINLEEKFVGDEIFDQTLGNKLLSLINKDFEWHTFFVMLFGIEYEMPKIECFKNFIGIVKSIFCSEELFQVLYEKLSYEDAKTVSDETQLFIAETLCKLCDRGIMHTDVYKKGLTNTRDFLTYNFNYMETLKDWVSKRRAIKAVIDQSIQVNLLEK